MKTWLVVALGGAVGTSARHAVNIWVHRRFDQSIPLATGVVNIVGCACIGVLAGLVAGEHFKLSASARTFIFVGLLGGFTTFSSFGLDTFTLVREGRVGVAVLNVAVQVGLGLGAVFAGYALGSVRS